MPIWKLEPKNLTSPHWAQSVWSDVAIIRAPNEKDARQEACLTFLVAVEAEGISETLHDPWKDPDLVTCERLENSEYKEDGPTEILYPTNYD